MMKKETFTFFAEICDARGVVSIVSINCDDIRIGSDETLKRAALLAPRATKKMGESMKKIVEVETDELAWDRHGRLGFSGSSTGESISLTVRKTDRI